MIPQEKIVAFMKFVGRCWFAMRDLKFVIRGGGGAWAAFRASMGLWYFLV